MFGKLDPYLKFRYRNKHYVSDKCKDGGHHPKWNKQFEIKVDKSTDFVVCELWNKNLIANDDYFGEGAFYIKQKNNLDNQSLQRIQIFQSGHQNGSIRINQNFVAENELTHVVNFFGLEYAGVLIAQPLTITFHKSIKVFAAPHIYLVIRYDRQIQRTSIYPLVNEKQCQFNDYLWFEKNAQE